MNDISRRTLIAAGTALAAGGARAADGPTPERAGKGADVLGPRNPTREAEEPNTVAPPTT
ncbi:MAG: oxalate decarboxylase, partial [Methylobacterium sp.]